jgi:hypothetical protein
LKTTDEVPVAQPYRRIPPNQLKEVQDHIRGLLEQKVIVESHSAYAAPVVVCRKKDNSIRLCVDYRKLNAKTIGDAYPLPRIQESFDALVGAQYFSTLDLASGYYQIAIAPEDRHETAFATPMGLFEYTRMPMGLMSAPATFQRLMQTTMSEFMFSFLLVYLDDLLVYSTTFEEHLEHLDRLLGRIVQTGLKLKMKKCQFLRREVKYLGHTISAEGVSCDQDKVEVIKNWPKLNADVRRFLGFATYFRRFICGFAKIAGPLHELVTQALKDSKKKTVDITRLWTERHQTAFDTLKAALSSAPVLAFADFTLPFILETDASNDGLGAILSQEQDGRKRVIAYASRRLRPTEQNDMNYSSMKLEFLAMKWAITEKFRDYLLGATFVVLTDNNPLVHFQTAKLGAVEQRWAAQLSQFQFTVQYRPGATNPADTLSRMPQDSSEIPPDVHVAQVHEVVCTCEEQTQQDTPSVLPQLTNRQLSDMQKADPVLQSFVEAWPKRPPPSASRQSRTLLRQHNKLIVKEGLLYRRVTDSVHGELHQLLLPAVLKADVLRMLHNDMGHQGLDRTLSLLKQRVYWPGMSPEVKDYIEQCERCVHNTKPHVHLPSGHLLASRPLEVIEIDFTKLEVASDGREDVLVITDVFTKFTQAIPTRNQEAG